MVFLQGGTTQGKVLFSGVPLNLWGVPTANLSIGTQKLTNVVDPTAAQDGATKNYVDTTFAGSGALIFQGGYAANTAAPSGAAATNEETAAPPTGAAATNEETAAAATGRCSTCQRALKSLATGGNPDIALFAPFLVADLPEMIQSFGLAENVQRL